MGCTYSTQQSLIAFRDDSISCKMKSYIQPFEKKLAYMELSALCNCSIDTDIIQPEFSYIKIPGGASEEVLLHRLAYWENIQSTTCTPTNQVLLEATYYSNINGEGQVKITRMPNTRILRYGPHDLHEYRGKFFPQLVKSLINIAQLAEGSSVIDPFCGSGTTNVESYAMGMNSVGIDLNPLSIKIAKSKVAILNIPPDLLAAVTEKMLSAINIDGKYDFDNLWEPSVLSYLKRWFCEEALQEIAIILYEIRNYERQEIIEFWEVCLSNILRSVSWQKETDLRVRKDIGEYTKGETLTRFSNECRRQLIRIVPYLKILNMNRVATYKIIESNTTAMPSSVIEEIGKCDALITSPPYATALPYLDTDRLSLLVLGLLEKNSLRDKNQEMIGNREVSEKQRQALWTNYLERKHELTPEIVSTIELIAQANHTGSVGFRRRNLPSLLAKYFLDMLDAMRVHISLLKNGASAFYVVGNNSTYINGKKSIIETDKLLWGLAIRAGYQQVDFIPMELLHSRDIFKDNQGTTESILFLRKAF